MAVGHCTVRNSTGVCVDWDRVNRGGGKVKVYRNVEV